MFKEFLYSILALLFPFSPPAVIKPSITPLPTAIYTTTSISLPSKYLLKTTFVPQAPEQNWDQPWQDACEEAALLTVVYYHNQVNPDIATIKSDLQIAIDYENSQGWSHDVNLTQMASISAQLYNLRPSLISNPSIIQIKQLISQNIPVIVPANGKTLYKENRNFTHGGPYYHNLVILGYDDFWQKFTVHDVGTRKGAYFQYSYQLLLDSIHDFPKSGNKEDIEAGDKKILILTKD